jgi:hypothetical protein
MWDMRYCGELNFDNFLKVVKVNLALGGLFLPALLPAFFACVECLLKQVLNLAVGAAKFFGSPGFEFFQHLRVYA